MGVHHSDGQADVAIYLLFNVWWRMEPISTPRMKMVKHHSIQQLKKDNLGVPSFLQFNICLRTERTWVPGTTRTKHHSSWHKKKFAVKNISSRLEIAGVYMWRTFCSITTIQNSIDAARWFCIWCKMAIWVARKTSKIESRAFGIEKRYMWDRIR